MLLFSLDDKENIRKCLEENGVVGILDVLNPQEINDTVREVESIIQNEIKSTKFNLNDPYSYHLTDNILNNYGVIGKQPIFTKQLLNNRYNENVRKAFSIAYNTEADKLFVHHDRLGWMRPTIGPGYEDWSKYKVPFVKPGLHIDIDPKGYYEKSFSPNVYKYLDSLDFKTNDDFISENNAKNITMGQHYQGLINLIDNEEQDGGFHCILGGHKVVKDWYDESKNYLPDALPAGRYIIKPDLFYDTKYFSGETTRIPCPAGTLIIFDAVLPHGTKPNFSQNYRLIQFLKYTPKNIYSDKTFKKRESALQKIYLKNNFIIKN